MNLSSFDTIGRAVQSLLQTKDTPLPDFLALPGVAEFLKVQLTQEPLPEEKMDELAKLVDDDVTTLMTAFLKAELPNFFEDCVDFYFSRAVVRVSLGFESLPSGSEELTAWIGP